jgi:ADP-ribose pyrophosphatase
MRLAMPSAPPPPPDIRLQVVDDHTARSKCDEGYLRVRRRTFVARYDDGSAQSESFKYDTIERWNPDAVAVLPHFEREGVRHVILRSAIRVPLAMRPEPLVEPEVFPPGAKEGLLWEIVAGLVEESERTPRGLVACAVRETEEEVGLRVDESSMHRLGGPSFPSAGIIGECIHYYECEIDPNARGHAAGDGPLERGARIF